MAENIFQLTVLASKGFKGSLEWVHNEEGSGARLYNNSVYFPDSRTKPSTQSGVTIDPGLDLGHAGRSMIDEVLDFYIRRRVLTDKEALLLRSAVGKRRFDAIEWMRANEKKFKGSFLVPDEVALYVMDMYTAPAYWQPLVNGVPNIKDIRASSVAAAIHTALLSMSYNRGPGRTVSLAKPYMSKRDYVGLASAIQLVKSPNKSLADRRMREGSLIFSALNNSPVLHNKSGVSNA